MPEGAEGGTPPSASVRVVNDFFWLKWAADSVDKMDDVRKASAEKLTAAVGWFWTVYTAVAVVGVTFSDRDLPLPIALLVFLPVVSLVVAYLLGVWTLQPVELEYDPRVPEEIRAAYIVAREDRRTRGTRALVATIVSGALVIVAGVLVAGTNTEDLPAFHASYSKAGGGDRGAILTSGRFDKNEAVTLKLTPTGVQGEKEVAVLETASATGKLRATIPVPMGKAAAYDVTATWGVEDGARHSIARSVKLEGG